MPSALKGRLVGAEGKGEGAVQAAVVTLSSGGAGGRLLAPTSPPEDPWAGPCPGPQLVWGQGVTFAGHTCNPHMP